jgi:type IV pilus assembly protein PilP
MRIQSYSRLLLTLSIAVVATACTRGTADLREWVQTEKAKKGAPLDPLPVPKTYETFEYKDQDLRDPFSPSPEEQAQSLAAASAGPHPDEHPKEPLEQYPLDALKMVGTIGTGGAVEGLVKDPDGVIHRVHPKNYLGQNYGKISGIAEDKIELVELVPNGVGGWIERQATVALADK